MATPTAIAKIKGLNNYQKPNFLSAAGTIVTVYFFYL
jgi:hypothetical protein